jgi:hypothetical protein
MKPTPSRPTPERFLSRWSRLKRAHDRAAPDDASDGDIDRADAPVADAERTDAAETERAGATASMSIASSTEAPALGTRDGPQGARAATTGVDRADLAPPAELPPIDSLTLESDYSPFFRDDVPESLRRAAVKKLFADPHFNVMDGLDTYIDDYSKPDPIPPAMLAALNHARAFLAKPEDSEPRDDRDAMKIAAAAVDPSADAGHADEVAAGAAGDSVSAPGTGTTDDADPPATATPPART